jgi:CheY-like chemotaxis protein
MGALNMARVLLVDDSVNILRSMEIALKAAGHETETATGPKEAMEKARAWSPDIMIVDVMMPGGTEGFELVWEIRGLENDPLQSVPIVMATGIQEQTGMTFYPWLPEGLFDTAKPLEVQGWLDKPVRVEVLLGAIKGVLSATK